MSAICKSCGQPLSEDYAFCPKCGAQTTPSGATQSGGTQEERNLAMLVWIGTIFLSFIPGLIVYLTKDDPYVKAQAREALNWSITAIFGYLIGWILAFVIIGIFVILAIAIMNLVFGIMGAVACSNGKDFRTPMTIRLLK